MPRARPVTSPADRVIRVRLRESVQFPDLTERLALKLSSVSHYTARAHFGVWHRRMGRPNFEQLAGIFTPLFYVELEVLDVALDPEVPLSVQGETYLARTLDAAGAIDHLVREGHHRLFAPQSSGAARLIGRARLLNVFTRYDADPARRRVTELPVDLGLGKAPSRVVDLPQPNTLLSSEQPPDLTEDGYRVWHYGQTDPNRHVTGMEYLRMMECFVAEALQMRGYDLRRSYFCAARILYRKPCFRGERYRRVAWIRSTEPLVICGAFYKEDNERPAVIIELTAEQQPEVLEGL